MMNMSRIAQKYFTKELNNLRVMHIYVSHNKTLETTPGTTKELQLPLPQQHNCFSTNHGFKYATNHESYSTSISTFPSESILSGTVSHDGNIFSDHKAAFGKKTNWELIRALGCFFMGRFPSFADNALRIMELTYSVLGQRLGNFLIRKTVYEQFVAGETIGDMKPAIDKLRTGGVGPILCCPMETFTPESGLTQEDFFNVNLEKVLDSIISATKLDDPFPMVQFKYTAFISGELLKLITPACKSTIHNPDVLNGVVDAMGGNHVDFSKFPGWESFPTERLDELLCGLRRIGIINEALQPHDIVALADAEYTYMNPALRLVALASKIVCNKRKQAKLFYTYQAYLKATHSELKEDLNFAHKSGFSLGVKLVRGAYMVQERQRAKELGYPDPLNQDFEATTASYHACLDTLMQQATPTSDSTPPESDSCLSGKAKAQQGLRQTGTRFIIATHNERTALYAMNRIEELQIPKDNGTVFFGQVYGMADHVSFVLGKNGYSVYKSIPYGNITDTLPYLARRAQENKAILANARRERELIMRTLRDRALLRG